MILIILGPQGSGKGTQAHLLSQNLGLFHFEAGSFLRELAKSDPEIDRTINEKGKLLSDEKMFVLVKDFLQKKEEILDGIVLDGYPRSVMQYKFLKDFFSEKGKRVDLAILINIPERESIRRLSARRIDKKTGEIYNLITNPPGKEVDPSDLVQREDDSPEAIKTRLSLYHQITEPLLLALKKDGILREVDGTRSIDDIYQEIEKIVSKKD